MVHSGGQGDYQNYQTYFNGDWVAWEDVMISPEDRGFGLADCVFDIGRTFNGKPFVLDRHIDRMFRSLRYLRIDCGLTPEEMTSICEEGIKRNEGYLEEAGDFTIHPWVTRGKSFDGPATVCISIKPVNFSKFAKDYVHGAHGVVARTRSYSSDVADPKVKHHNRLNFVLAEVEVRDVDPEASPILLDQDGNLTEGIGYNVFLVKDGVLKTATDRSILQGISRGVTMEVARQLGIPVVEENLQPYDLYTADEVFFTRTSPRITPVSKVDNRPVGEEFPGPITNQLLAATSERAGVDIVGQALHRAGIEG